MLRRCLGSNLPAYLYCDNNPVLSAYRHIYTTTQIMGERKMTDTHWWIICGVLTIIIILEVIEVVKLFCNDNEGTSDGLWMGSL